MRIIGSNSLGVASRQSIDYAGGGIRRSTMVANWHEQVEEEAWIVRKLSDQAAFDHIVSRHGPEEPMACGTALHLIRRRPWRKEFHLKLAEMYLPKAHHNQIDLAIECFLTFMKADTLSYLLWKYTKNGSIERDFAIYHFIRIVAKEKGIEHPSLERWRYTKRSR